MTEPGTPPVIATIGDINVTSATISTPAGTIALRGSAWTAALKDVLILIVVVILGIYLPLHYFGGFSQMFHAIDAAKPGFLTLPAKGMSPSWFVSTVLLSAFGVWSSSRT